MAIGGTPVGNMVIKVDLDSAGVEKSMTGLQRQLKSSNKAMGAQLSAFGRGEKSAAKYGVLIEGLSNRHRIQARMVQEARAKYDHMTRTYGENSVKAQQASQELNEQIARYQETGRELDNVTAEFQEFQRVQEIQSKGWYKVADGMDEWGGKLKTAGTAMDQTGKKLTRSVTLPLTVVGGLAIKTGADFEAGMSKVGAVSGASAGDMQKLEAKAREMGKTTVFSAKEASDAFYYMSLAGWDASDMMDGISGVMDLAAASGEDLALVSDIVTDGLTAFGLQAKDSGRMADVLASASANANTDVNGLGQAFKYVAPVAGALGFTMEDTSKAIGLMSNSGIKAQKAGTALRTMMTNLSKPTDDAKKLMDKYGISLTDSEGNMKSFDDVMKDLRKGFSGLSEEQQAQAASTIFGKEAMSGALAIINASEEDYNSLSDAIKNSDGAASEMADTMQDNLQGSLKELKSMLEDLFIEMYQNLKPALNDVVDGAKDLTQWFANLSPKTQENILKFGLLAAAMGPVLSITGKLTFGVGSLMQGTGALAKTIGLSKGAGLLGAMSGLGPVAVGGLAVAGLTAVGVAAYNLTKDSEKLEKVNLDVAKSLSDQASGLEESANTFDKLSGKAKISNEELAQLNDLNIRISESSNPATIKELQKQYNELAKKSGLSKDELEALFGANETIINQSPNVEKSISDQGNAFAENTDAVRKYIDSLHEATLIELEAERTKALENEVKLRERKTKQQNELNGLLEHMGMYTEAIKLDEDEIAKRKDEIVKRQGEITQGSEESLKLQEEYTTLQDIQDGNYSKAIEHIQSQIDEKRESINITDEELAKIDELNGEMANLVLKQAGINEEGDKGLAQLDKSIAKNDEELAKLDSKLDKNGKLTTEEQERYNQLVETNGKQKEARDYLHDELGIQKDINSLVNGKLSSMDKETKKNVENHAQKIGIKNVEKDIIKEIDKKNGKLTKERSELEKNLKKQGATKDEINNQTKKLDTKISKNAEVKKQIMQELGVWDKVDKSIRDGVNKEIQKGKAAGTVTGALGKQGSQIDKNNQKTDAGTKKERERSKEAGKSVNKKVTAKDFGTVANIDRRAKAGKSKKVSLYQSGLFKINRDASAGKSKKVSLYQSGLAQINRDASRPVSKVVNITGRLLGSAKKIMGYAKGTPKGGHPYDGLAVVGDGGGRELITLPSGKSFLSPATDTILPLPKGAHVTPHRETEKLMKLMPRYADGTDGWTNSLRNSEFAKLLAINNRNNESNVVIRGNQNRNNKANTHLKDLLSATLQQNEILMQLLNKNQDIYMQERLVGGILSPIIDENLERDRKRRDKFRG